MDMVAIFDQDGTLSKGNIGASFYEWLVQTGIIDEKKIESVFGESRKSLAMRYMKKEITTDEVIERYLERMCYAIKGKEVCEIERVVGEFFEKKAKFWEGVCEAFDTLRENGFDTYIISGSPKEIVSYTAKIFNATGFRATEFYIKKGVYTGTGIGLTSEKKAVATREIVKKYSGSFGVGDSGGDAGIFDNVDVILCWNFRDPELLPEIKSIPNKTVLEYSPSETGFYDAVVKAMEYVK